MARLGSHGEGLRMLFLIGLALGAILMFVAQRRAEAIRFRVERRWGDLRPASWEGWQRTLTQACFDRHLWWREPY